MATETRHSGTLRTDYESDLAHADALPAMESEWQRLMHRLVRYSRAMGYREEDGQEGSLSPLLENHVLTVVADILRKRLQGYDESFADAQGTLTENVFKDKLENDIKGWIKRLDAFINQSWKAGQNKSSTVTVATTISDQLNHALVCQEHEMAKQQYYRLLRTVKSIQSHADYYLNQIEYSGDIDGALSLLIAFLKHYCGIADTFNNRLSALSALYQKEILHVKPGEVVQDNTYVVVSPTETCTLKAGQGFFAGQNAAGEDMIYRIPQAETVSPLQCTEVDAVYLFKDGGDKMSILRQTICKDETVNTATLFDGSQSDSLSLGWQIESPMLVLNEGSRAVTVTFILENGSPLLLSASNDINGFSFYLSHAEGWQEMSGQCRASREDLEFQFTLKQDGMVPAACHEEIHGRTSSHPVLRIQTKEQNKLSFPFDLISQMKIDAVKIRVHVTGIHNFTFYNELGEVDTLQPFQPFGLQANRGSWFLFGNEEMGLKPLSSVRMKGLWQKMPETQQAFNDRYRDYGLDTSSFKVSTEFQQNSAWKPCATESQQLLTFDDTDKTWEANILFNFDTSYGLTLTASSHYEYSRDKDGFFRVTLQSPSEGFGTDAYRKLYTETMIYNARAKEKNQKALPQVPVTPILSDVEMEYEAEEIIEKSPATELFLLSDNRQTCFSSRISQEEDKALYFAFTHAKGLQSLRMYVTMALPAKRIPYHLPKPDGNVSLTWEYLNGHEWTALPSKSITAEETNGFTQSGFIEIKLPAKVSDTCRDSEGKTWIRATVKGDCDTCLSIRGIWTNCLLLSAQNGDGAPLDAGTIKDMQDADGRIALITQPLPGFGGRQAATEKHLSSQLRSRFNNRHRAVNPKDYEQIVLEHFTEVDKAVCIPCTEPGSRRVRLAVFCSASDNGYYLSPAWKLKEMERAIRPYAPPFVQLEVINPVYEEIKVVCKAVLREDVVDEGKVIRNLVVLAQNYLAPWKLKGLIPELQQTYSYKELHARMANHEDLQTLVYLKVGDIEPPSDYGFDSKDREIKGKYPYSILIPKVEIILLSPQDGIDSSEIGSSFIIK